MMRIGAAMFLLAWILAGCAHRANLGEDPGALAIRIEEPAQEAGAEEGAQASYFNRLWELDERSRRDRDAIVPHRPSYFVSVSYLESPNVDAVRAADPRKELKNLEALFQVSFKVKLWEDVLGEAMDLWCGYTQRSFWQVYNFDDSSPFRETDYEPELLLNLRTDYDVLGLHARFLNLGLNHQSHGQSEPLSRSWNRVGANLGLESAPFSLLAKGWYRIPESTADDDNPGMEKYMGYGELWADCFLGDHRLGLVLRNNLRFRGNRGSVQVEWSFPLFDLQKVQGYVQYFNGFGDRKSVV